MHLQLHDSASRRQSDAGQRAICEYLVDSGKLAPDNVSRALRLQAEQQQSEKIGSILVKLGLVSERDVAESLRDQLGLRFVERNRFPDEPWGSTEISFNFLKKNLALVLDEDDEALTLVMADPRDQYVIEAVSLCSGKTVLPCVGVPSEIEATLKQLEEGPATAAAPLALNSLQFLDDVEQLKELAGEAPIIKLVNQVIIRAAESGASDIHIEPFEGELKIRFRVDGLLREIESPPTESAAAVISRVKIMANLNIAERRLSQDGRFRHRVRGVDYDFRVSTVPTMYGESVVMRLLQRDQTAQDFEALGFTPEQTGTMKEILAMPHGILLVTGPTGSGKSTTLYAALNHLNDPERMIITVEDPVEYNIPGINQMQVKPQIGLTFATALRSIVRQDPDVIMIGEMRDSETAQIAVQSALTGHLVLSTLHTNDAPSSVMRLIDMGVQDYLLTSAVNAVQAQRLVRKLCDECKEPYQPMAELARRWGLDRATLGREATLYRARGCDACGHTGYSGRRAILEILRISDEMRRLVLSNADASGIRRLALAEGMVPMRQDGFQKALQGITSIEEVLRVTPEQAE
ncbi:MAG: type II secretion system ATPase GspE [Gammaproteobacteria bacterium]|nr:type II secretion system ATPase GspE [Gammaproteobacteria bacterium]MDH4253169.1 type II secretion system ATPase GspE [Gammaproteobacteria bacterium]MDH5308469.1 type II secretion system ATPase GspE [Gammaproteobacteria bacterium]